MAQGKVYGFVPMGDSNPDTEGFRFWKQGYWKSHLGSMPCLGRRSASLLYSLHLHPLQGNSSKGSKDDLRLYMQCTVDRLYKMEAA